MKLFEYMRRLKLTDADMAAQLGCSVGAVKKWRYKERTPRPDKMRQIAVVTKGKVTANDFMEVG